MEKTKLKESKKKAENQTGHLTDDILAAFEDLPSTVEELEERLNECTTRRVSAYGALYTQSLHRSDSVWGCTARTLWS